MAPNLAKRPPRHDLTPPRTLVTHQDTTICDTVVRSRYNENLRSRPDAMSHTVTFMRSRESRQ